MPTGSWVRALNDDQDTNMWSSSYILYDYKGRPIFTKSGNFLGGYTSTETNLDFAGLPQYSATEHRRISSDGKVMSKDIFTYTDQGRLDEHLHQNKIGDPLESLSKNTYSELGRLTNKNVGGIQSGTPLQLVDYAYNIRGWLTGINDTNDLKYDTDHDLFAFHINYDTTSGLPCGVQEQYNGNISETFWRTASDNVLRKYGYQYDDLNRMTSAIYQKPDASSPLTNSYNESASYDLNGNITIMKRNGNLDVQSMTLQIDDLKYNYNPSSNLLTGVYDNSNSTVGFKDNPGATPFDVDYTYDANGNILTDANKGITSTKYNHLNLPTEIIFNDNQRTKINYIYSATGEKLQKKVFQADGSGLETTYLDGFQYNKDILKFFPTSEGYVNVTSMHGENYYNYVYNYLDHLGNIRLSYGLDPETHLLKVLEENQYYPYGLKHAKYNPDVNAYKKKDIVDEVELKPAPGDGVGSTNYKIYNYKFNGMEYQDELGLNLYDMDMRDYDPAIGRWLGIDPVTNYNQSPYNAFDSNPVIFADPSGADAAYTVSWAANTAYLNNSLGSSSNWGQSAVGGDANGYINNLADNAIGFSTSSSSEINSIIGHYALQNGFSRYSFIEFDSSASGGIGGGFCDYKSKSSVPSGVYYGGDGSGGLMDNVHKLLYLTDQINPMALAWDGLMGKSTGADRFGNKLTPLESSMKIASAIPVGRYASATESVLSHIFRDAVGHVNPATITSQMRYFNLFENVASNSGNVVPTVNAAAKAAGVVTYNQTFRNGSTVWVQAINGTIRNAGVNVP